MLFLASFSLYLKTIIPSPFALEILSYYFSIQNMPQFLQVKFIKFSKRHEIPIIQNRI